MKVKILDKRIGTDWTAPGYETDLSAGIDLRTMKETRVMPGQARLLSTGIAIALDENTAGFIYPRSGLGHKKGLVLGNGVGVIDADYRGEIMVSLTNRNISQIVCVKAGDRIAQLVVHRIDRPIMELVDELPGTERGAGGFGSTGGA